VSFEPETFKVGFHEVTNWFRELPDKIFEVRLSSGRRVNVTAGHNLFSLDERGDLVKTPTGELKRGTRVAIPGHIPDPASDPPEYRTLDLLPGGVRDRLSCLGPTTDTLIRERGLQVRRLLAEAGLSARYWLGARKLPLALAERVTGGVPALGPGDRVAYAGSRASLPAVLRIDEDLAWLLGMYVAEGYRRARQVVISNTDQCLLDKVEAVFLTLGQRVYRSPGSVVCLSTLLPHVFRALGMGDGASTKRLPHGALGWPRPLLQALLRGLLDGDGSARRGGEVLWTTSSGLTHDALSLAARLGRRGTTQVRQPRAGCQTPFSVSLASNEHKMLTAVPSPSILLTNMRSLAGLSQVRASALMGYKHPTSLNNIEKRQARAAVRLVTLRRMRSAYDLVIPKVEHRLTSGKLDRLVDGNLLWDEVVEVVDTGRFETVYDLEVRPDGAPIENFLAGHGGVFVSNTAGYVDPGFRGHLTLELSNAASLPIQLYPRMKIGQLSFLRMTTPADRPYGTHPLGSKYQGQDEPTASRVHLDFDQRR
jgi:Intein splicing domain/dCTP deaminase-like/LAGLIDADG-like domain